MHNLNCDEESEVEEHYDDNKTFKQDEKKKISNEHSKETKEGQGAQ